MIEAMLLAGGQLMHTVTFFDWDGTHLGSRAVPHGGRLLGDHETPEQRGDGPEQAPLPPEYNLLWDANGNGVYDYLGINDPGNDVSNKMGYVFAGWVDRETGHSVPNVLPSAPSGQLIDEAELVSLNNITSDLCLKAAYSEVAEMLGTNVSRRRYMISYTPFVLEEGELRSYITVRRPQNGRRNPEGEIYLCVDLNIKNVGQWRFAPIRLGTSDVETVFIQVPFSAGANLDDTVGISFYAMDRNGAGRSATVQIPGTEVYNHAATE